jgi:hypothetical protein
MSIEYPYRNYLFLYGASTKVEVINYVETKCVPEEKTLLQQILSDWAEASATFQSIEETEKGEAEKIQVQEIPPEFYAEIKEVENDFLFKQTFSLLPYDFKVVEIDRLVACQRAVNLDYVDILKSRVPANPTLSDLIKICLAPPKQVKPPAEQVLALNAYTFTSENLDFRFLGGFKKSLTQDDILSCQAGGYPLAAIVLLVGLGSSAMNVLAYRNRFILNNGFHRAYALRSLGVTHIPVVIQRVTNPQIEMAPVVADLPSEYLLGAARPALMKDFLNPKLTKQLKVKAWNKVVQVQWVAQQFSIPIVG